MATLEQMSEVEEGVCLVYAEQSGCQAEGTANPKALRGGQVPELNKLQPKCRIAQ
jgi:hypothetical protein